MQDHNSILRFATFDDIDQILVLLRDLHKELDIKESFIESDVIQMAQLVIQNNNLMVFEIDGEIVSCLGFMILPKSCNFSELEAVEICMVAKKGYNRYLLILIDKAIEYYKTINVNSIKLGSRVPSLDRLYKKKGFILEEKIYKLEY